jgi:hypothetical protein
MIPTPAEFAIPRMSEEQALRRCALKLTAGLLRTIFPAP